MSTHDVCMNELRYIASSTYERAQAELERQLADNPETANAELAFTLAVKARWEDQAMNELQRDLRSLPDTDH